ncbi:MAG: 50S ribosomal protein L9 [Helicobacter sp.]|nr:50S ribosomal protein L9 [Helicobacter sp.]
MKVLLLEDVQGLGKKGEIHEVKDGYGQNFLISKNKALLATNEVVRKFKAQVAAKEEEKALDLVKKRQLLASLELIKLEIQKQAGKDDALFGAITKEEIAQALEVHNIFIDKKCINFQNPIKKIGDFTVEIKLGSNVNGILNLKVTPK